MTQDNYPTETITTKRKRRNPWQWFTSLSLFRKVLTVGALIVAFLIALPIFAMAVDPDGFAETQEQAAQEREEREAEREAERELEEERERQEEEEAEAERQAEEEAEAERQAEEEREAEEQAEREAEEERQREEEEAAEEEAAAQEAEEAEEEEDEEPVYTIEVVDEFAGEEAHINFDLPDHFTGGLIASEAQNIAREALAEAYADHPGMYRYVVFIHGEDGFAANSAFEPGTLESLDLDDATLNVFDHLDAGSAHPDLLG